MTIRFHTDTSRLEFIGSQTFGSVTVIVHRDIIRRVYIVEISHGDVRCSIVLGRDVDVLSDSVKAAIIQGKTKPKRVILKQKGKKRLKTIRKYLDEILNRYNGKIVKHNGWCVEVDEQHVESLIEEVKAKCGIELRRYK